MDDMVGGLVYIATKYTFCMYKLYVRSGPFYDIVFGQVAVKEFGIELEVIVG